MNFVELRDRLAEDGIRSVKEARYKEYEERGALRGFEMVRSCQDEGQLVELVKERRNEDHEAYIASHDERITIEDYWAERWCSLQVEHCWEVVKVGLGIYPQSARAGLKYAEVVGVKKP